MGFFDESDVFERLNLRMALYGPPGGGKSFSSLNIARLIGESTGDKTAVIDTERKSSQRYRSHFKKLGFSYTPCYLEKNDPDNPFSPKNYRLAIQAAQKSGFKILIIDSLSHAWMGQGGALDMVNNASKASQSGNSFAAWRNVTPEHNKLVDAMLDFDGHIIVTMRSKVEWMTEEYTDSQGRKKVKPVKVGMAPVQKDGLEYEFDITARFDEDNNMIIEKTRCSRLAGKIFNKPDEEFTEILMEWLNGDDSGDEDTPQITFESEDEEPKKNAVRLVNTTNPIDELKVWAKEHQIDYDQVVKPVILQTIGFTAEAKPKAKEVIERLTVDHVKQIKDMFSEVA